jgi:hypothetical protein
MNESKVVRYETYVAPDVTNMVMHMEGTYVTHADYRSLEEINRKLVRKANTLTIETARLEEELAALRTRAVDK